MNHVALLGRLTRDPEVRYSQASEPLAIAKYTLAVNRRYKREGEPDADFINCTCFGKTAEFAQQYFVKGQKVAIEGRIQVSSWEDKETGKRQWRTEVIVEDQYFAESKRDTQQANDSQQQTSNQEQPSQDGEQEDFFAIGDGLDEQSIPF